MKGARQVIVDTRVINIAMAKQKISRTELAEKAGLSINTISLILNKKVNPNESTVGKICEVLKISPAKVIV